MNLTLSQQTKELLNKHNIRLKKSLGQNLMIDKAVIERIIEAAELTKQDAVIEIGTGTGLLTKELAKVAKRVITFEVDKKIVEAAKDYLADCKNVEIINEDFLKGYRVQGAGCSKDNFLLATGPWLFIPSEAEGLAPKVVANIPYYITTPIIEKIIEGRKAFSLAVLTVQREFAERMSAKPGTKEYGSFTVFLNYYCEAGIVSLIPKTSFIPQPDVGSAVIRLKFRQVPAVDVKDEKLFFKVVRASFSQRRKTLRNCLLTIFESGEVDPALSRSGIDGKRRGETLSIQEFAKLSHFF